MGDSLGIWKADVKGGTHRMWTSKVKIYAYSYDVENFDNYRIVNGRPQKIWIANVKGGAHEMSKRNKRRGTHEMLTGNVYRDSRRI